MDFSYRYSNLSFGQGDQGTIKYLNQWKRSIDPEDTARLNSTFLTSVNLAVEKLYNYEYYATPTRQFVLNYNFLWQSLTTLLPRFYGLYLHRFYLHDTEVVRKQVLERVTLSLDQMRCVQEDSQYGWADEEHMAHWFRLVNLREKEQMRARAEFELIRESCGLGEAELLALVGPGSVLNQLSQALNGTIKNKV